MNERKPAGPLGKPKLTPDELLYMLNPGEHPALSDSVKRALDELLARPEFQGPNPQKQWAKALYHVVTQRPEVFTDKLDDRVALKTWTALFDKDGEPLKTPWTDHVLMPDGRITVFTGDLAKEMARKRGYKIE